MNILHVAILILVLAAITYAWYTEKERRMIAELAADIAKRRQELDKLQTKLEENKEAYDKALRDLGGIPADMFDNVGKPLPPGANVVPSLYSATFYPDGRGGRVSPVDTDRKEKT